jgi:hypothetical protein
MLGSGAIMSQKTKRFGFLTLAVFTASIAMGQKLQAQDDDFGSSSHGTASSANKDDKEKEVVVEATDEDFTPRKTFTRAERQAICRKYEGKLIAFYSEVYKVVGCVRRPILSNKTVYSLMRSGMSVMDVDADIIAAIREGEPLDQSISIETARTCKQLEGKYVTFSSVDVYYIENCKKRLFPDWTTYTTHRQKHGDAKGKILSLSLVEFEQIYDGDLIPSVVDDMFARLLKGEVQVDVIPLDEACQGLNNRVASYYSKLYRIENCRKREILHPDLFFKKLGGPAIKVTEMRSEQWLSLPDGKDIDNAKTQAKPQTPISSRH